MTIKTCLIHYAWEMTGINGRPGRSRDLERFSLSPLAPEMWSFVHPPTGFIYMSVRYPSWLVLHSLFRPAALRILIGRTAVIFIHSCFNTGSISRFFFIIAMFVSEDRFFLRKSMQNCNVFAFYSISDFIKFQMYWFCIIFNIYILILSPAILSTISS